MKRVSAFAGLVLLLTGVPATAMAGPATGSTDLLGAALAGSSVNVEVEVISTTPVVAYEYSVVNQCWFTGKASGPSDSYQRDDIVDWVYSTPPPHGSVPQAIMALDLTSVPAGATCKVSLVKNNTLVKGSVTKYTVC